MPSCSHPPLQVFNELEESQLGSGSGDLDPDSTPPDGSSGRMSGRAPRERMFSEESYMSSDNEHYAPVGYRVSQPPSGGKLVRQGTGVVSVFEALGGDSDQENSYSSKAPSHLAAPSSDAQGGAQQVHPAAAPVDDDTRLVDIDSLEDRDDDLGVSTVAYVKGDTPPQTHMKQLFPTVSVDRDEIVSNSQTKPSLSSLKLGFRIDLLKLTGSGTGSPKASPRQPSSPRQAQHQSVFSNAAVVEPSPDSLSLQIPAPSPTKTSSNSPKNYELISAEVAAKLNATSGTFSYHSNNNSSSGPNTGGGANNESSNQLGVSTLDMSQYDLRSNNTSQSDIRSLPSFYEPSGVVSPRRRTISNTTLSTVGAATRKYIVSENGSPDTHNCSNLSMSPGAEEVKKRYANFSISRLDASHRLLCRHSFGGVTNHSLSQQSPSDSESPMGENKVKRSSFNAFTGVSFYKQRIVPLNGPPTEVVTVAAPSPLSSEYFAIASKFDFHH